MCEGAVGDTWSLLDGVQCVRWERCVCVRERERCDEVVVGEVGVGRARVVDM